MWVEGILNAQGPHPHSDHLCFLTNGVTSPGGHSGVFLVSMILRALIMERCATLLILHVDSMVDNYTLQEVV